MSRQLTVSQARKLLEINEVKAAELIVENEFRSPADRLTYEKIAEQIGISERQLYNWRHKPEFIMYVNMLVDLERESFYPTVMRQLHKAIEGTSNNGIASIRGIDLWLKATGRMVERREVITTEVKAPTMSRKEISEEIAKLNEFIEK